MKAKKPDLESEKNKYQQRILDLTRQLLNGFDLQNVKQLDSLNGEERQAFARFCHTTYHSPYFKLLIDSIYYPQLMFAATAAPNYDIVSFNRASANGTSLVSEVFQKWANIFDTDYSGDRESFDPAKPFEPTNQLNNN